jgi:hypothetical protein
MNCIKCEAGSQPPFPAPDFRGLFSVISPSSWLGISGTPQRPIDRTLADGEFRRDGCQRHALLP